MRRLSYVIAAVTVAAAVAGTAVAQSAQRFTDVPPHHPDFAAIEWAAEAGVTAGYGDGTFRPSQPLSKRHALVFMERYYDSILGAAESEDFTRGDMMRVLYEMAGGGESADDSAEVSTTETSTTTSPSEGNVWAGTSTLAGEPWPVLCGRDSVEFTLNLIPRTEGDAAWDGLLVLLSNPGKGAFELSVTGPAGATTLLHFPRTLVTSRWFSFGPHPNTVIDAGEASFSFEQVRQPISDAEIAWANAPSTMGERQRRWNQLRERDPIVDWGMLVIASDTPSPEWATTKRLQQWANSVSCET